MALPFITTNTAAKIKALNARGFATRMEIEPTVNLVLHRDVEQDGTDVELAPQLVIISLAAREATPGEAFVPVAGADGTFEKVYPFDVRKGDSFELAGPTAGSTIFGTITSVDPPVDGIVTADFTLRE